MRVASQRRDEAARLTRSDLRGGLVLLAALLLELALLLGGRVLVLLVLGDKVVPAKEQGKKRNSMSATTIGGKAG